MKEDIHIKKFTLRMYFYKWRKGCILKVVLVQHLAIKVKEAH